MVHPGDALKARTDEGGRQDHPFAQATHLELVRGEKRHFTWRRRRPKQQSKSGDQKILRIQDSGHAHNLAISQARQTSGYRNRPRIFLTKGNSYGFKTADMLTISLYHKLGKLPVPEIAHEYFQRRIWGYWPAQIEQCVHFD